MNVQKIISVFILLVFANTLAAQNWTTQSALKYINKPHHYDSNGNKLNYYTRANFELIDNCVLKITYTDWNQTDEWGGQNTEDSYYHYIYVVDLSELDIFGPAGLEIYKKNMVLRSVEKNGEYSMLYKYKNKYIDVPAEPTCCTELIIFKNQKFDLEKYRSAFRFLINQCAGSGE